MARKIVIEFTVDDDSPLTGESFIDAVMEDLTPTGRRQVETSILHEDPAAPDVTAAEPRSSSLAHGDSIVGWTSRGYAIHGAAGGEGSDYRPTGGNGASATMPLRGVGGHGTAHRFPIEGPTH